MKSRTTIVVVALILVGCILGSIVWYVFVENRFYFGALPHIGLSYLHPANVDWSKFGNNRRIFWGGNITLYKQQITSDLQLIRDSGYNMILLSAPSDYNYETTKVNMEWIINTANNKGLTVIAWVTHLYALGDPMIPTNDEYANYVGLMTFFAKFHNVISVSNFSYTLNVTKIMNFYNSLPSEVKVKFILHSDDPFLETYIPIPLPHIYEAYSSERIALIKNKNEYVVTGVDLHWTWVNGKQNNTD